MRQGQADVCKHSIKIMNKPKKPPHMASAITHSLGTNLILQASVLTDRYTYLPTWKTNNLPTKKYLEGHSY